MVCLISGCFANFREHLICLILQSDYNIFMLQQQMLKEIFDDWEIIYILIVSEIVLLLI